jgi:hypothetical protein
VGVERSTKADPRVSHTCRQDPGVSGVALEYWTCIGTQEERVFAVGVSTNALLRANDEGGEVVVDEMCFLRVPLAAVLNPLRR